MRWISGFTPALSFFLLSFCFSYPLSLSLSSPMSPCFTTFFFFLFFSCCGDQSSLFCPSQSPLFYGRFKHLGLSATHIAPSGQLSEQQQVTWHLLLWGFFCSCSFGHRAATHLTGDTPPNLPPGNQTIRISQNWRGLITSTRLGCCRHSTQVKLLIVPLLL